MVLDAVSNFVRGRVAAAVDDTQTTLSVDDASIFPDPATDGEFNVVVWDANNFPRPDQDGDVEVLRVTGVDTGTDELTVARAQEGTSDVAHPEGSAVHLSPTAKMFSDIEAEYTAQGENFDGEGTSEFSNLQSVSTDNLENTSSSVVPLNSTEGEEPSTTGDRALAVGAADSTEADGLLTTAIGSGAVATDSSATALGGGAEASGFRSTAIGQDADASGSTSTAVGRSVTASNTNSSAFGAGAEAINADEGVLGGDGFGETDEWTVPGDFSVQGSKDFQIDHPSKPDTHDLKHGAYEGPVPGGLIYNATVSVEDERADLSEELPEYVTNGDFGTRWVCHVTPSDHFGRGFVEADRWVLVVDKPGEYEVTIFGERDDDAALKNGGDRFEKPKGERWNGDPRSYWRDCPHISPDDYDDVRRVEEKFAHTEECDPEPCEEAHEAYRVTFEGGDRIEVEDAEFGEGGDIIVQKARDLRDGEEHQS